MQSMDLVEIDKTFIGMIYGKVGAGKTTLTQWLAQVLAAGEPILYCDSADGWVSLQNTPDLMENTTRIAINEASELTVIANALKNRSKGFEDFRVLVIDELSSLAEEILEDVVRDRSGTAKDELLPEIEGKDYGPQGQIIMSIVRNLKKVDNLHIILVAHSREKTDHRKVTTIYPQFPPLLGGNLQKLMHVTSYVTASVKERKGKTTYEREVQSQPTALILAKSRIGHMPVTCDFETYVNVIADWVEGDLAEEGTPSEQDDAPTELAADELPTDGIPVADTSEDDEPAYAD